MMNIATALNKKYIRYTIVMLTSLCINNPEHIEAYLLHSELENKDISFMRECMSEYDITIIPLKVNGKIFDEKCPHNSQWTIETYFRLFLPDMLPETVKRLLYLDVDIIVNKTLSSLYNMEFSDTEIIACIDSLGKSNWSVRTNKQNEMFHPMIEAGYMYFNAGVMLMNMEIIRKNYSFDTYLEAIKSWNYEMSAPDQDILNYVHWQKVGYVDPYEYDLFARIAHNEKMTYAEVKEKTYIIHYAGEKPWQSENVHFDIEKLWWDYAKSTPFYGELLEEFLLETLTDVTVENYIYEILNNKETITQAYEKTMEINRRLLTLLENK